jgi:bile acid:Na+ symporter, BASS family
MLSVGLSLSMRSFYVTFARPRAFITGLALQMVWLPLMAFLLIMIPGLPVAFKIGIIILAACPGGMTSNFLSYLLNANAALSIALTVVNSVLAIFTIPIIVNLALGHFLHTRADLHLPFWGTVRQIFFISIVPVILGIIVRRWRPVFAHRIQDILKWVTVFLLAVLFLIKFFASENQGGSGITTEEILIIFPFSLAINTLALASGYFAGQLQGLSDSDRITLGIEIGIQNTSLAFVVAGTFLQNEDMLKPALVYAMFTFFTALLYGLIIRPREFQRIVGKFTRWLRSFSGSAAPKL